MTHLPRLVTAAVASVATVLAVLLSATPSLAAQMSQPPMTFSGQCQLSGTVAFTPLLTVFPQPVSNQATASGTCSGSITDGGGHTSQVTNAAARYRATEAGAQESCELNTNAPGSGELIFEQGTLTFQIVENRVGPTAILSLTGSGGGSATAIANVNSPDPAGVVEQCGTTGAASAPVDLTIQTTFAISG